MFYVGFIHIIYQQFHRGCRNLNEFKYIASLLYPKYVEPVKFGNGKKKLGVGESIAIMNPLNSLKSIPRKRVNYISIWKALWKILHGNCIYVKCPV